MSRLIRFAMCAVVAMGVGFVGGSSAQAGGYGYAQHCHYEWVTTFEVRQVKDVIYVTKYDAYGYPHQVAKVVYKTVKVPVRKYVKVCH